MGKAKTRVGRSGSIESGGGAVRGPKFGRGTQETRKGKREKKAAKYAEKKQGNGDFRNIREKKGSIPRLGATFKIRGGLRKGVNQHGS